MTTFHTVDSVLFAHNGEDVTVIGPLSLNLYDAVEVGPMLVIRFADGSEAEVFADEVAL